MQYICRKDYEINDILIGRKGDELEITDVKPNEGQSPESVEGYCDIKNLTTNQVYEATWNDVDDETLTYIPKTFEKDDVVYVSNLDTGYDDKHGVRIHSGFFGRVIDVEEYDRETIVGVKFLEPNGHEIEWWYNSEELSLANELENLTLKEFVNKFNVRVNAVYL